MANLFDMEEVLDLERYVIDQLGGVEQGGNYFKEEVAQYLYRAWAKDHQDTRILVYSFPLIQYTIIAKHKVINEELDQDDIFSALCVVLLEHLHKYRPESGKLFSYLTLILKFKLIDIITAHIKRCQQTYSYADQIDSPVDEMKSFVELLSFKQYLENKKETEGKSTVKIIIAILEVINSDKYNLKDRAMFLGHLETLTGLPKVIISPTLDRLIDNYFQAVID